MDIIDRVLLAFSPTVAPWHDDVRRIGCARKAITTALAKLAAAEAARPEPVETANMTSGSGARFRRSTVQAEIKAQVASLEPSFSQLTVKYVQEGKGVLQ